MMNKTFALLIGIAISLMAVSAFGMDLIPVGSYQISNLSTNNNGATNTGVSQITEGANNTGSKVGGGLLISQTLASAVSLQLGVLYLPRQMNATFTGVSAYNGTYNQEWDFNYVQIPVVVRYNFLPFLSLGLGGYYAKAIGLVKETTSGTGPTSGLSLQNAYSYSEQGMPTDDYGLIGSLGVNMPISGNSVSFYLDARYIYGLKNIALQGNAPFNNDTNFAGDTNHWRDIQFLAGLSFALDGGH